jgi:hypothetical protein
MQDDGVKESDGSCHFVSHDEPTLKWTMLHIIEGQTKEPTICATQHKVT